MRLIDADKLIEKLRDFKEWENDDGRPIHTMSEIQRIDRCINFVQMEPIAVADDVCEWKVFDNSLTDEPQWVYGTTCGKYVGEEHTSKAFAYCPYCGKKIKVVE